MREEQAIEFLFEMAKIRKPSSVGKYTTYLKHFFAFLARRRGYPFDFQLKNLAFAKNNLTLPRHLNSKDLSLFLRTLLSYTPKSSYEKRNKCILIIVILGGLRRAETQNLQLKNFKEEGDDYVINVLGKGGNERKIFIKKKFLEAPLSEWLSDQKRLKFFDGDFIFKKSRSKHCQKNINIIRFIAKIFKESGIENWQQYGSGLHCFRHSFATYVYDKTQDLILTSRVLGHQNIGSTKIYIHTSQSHHKKVSEIFNTQF